MSTKIFSIGYWKIDQFKSHHKNGWLIIVNKSQQKQFSPTENIMNKETLDEVEVYFERKIIGSDTRTTTIGYLTYFFEL